MPPLLLAIVSGLLMSLIGVAFGLGGRHGVRPPHIAVFMGLCGLVVFGALAGRDVLRATPAAVWWIGLATGITQYLGVVALGAALRRGPLSPAWCAAAMIFLPVLVYARIALGEQVGGLRLTGVALACVCVVLASLQGGNAPAGAGRRDWNIRATLFYGLLLVLVVVNASSVAVAMKILGARMADGARTWMDAYGLAMYTASYGVFGVCMLGDTLARPPPAGSRRVQWLAGAQPVHLDRRGRQPLRHPRPAQPARRQPGADPRAPVTGADGSLPGRGNARAD